MQERSGSTRSLDELAAQLPSIAAVIISEYVHESAAFIKLHRLIDAAEMITRFLCVTMINDVYAQFGQFPHEFRYNQLLKLRRPSFGPWKNMLAGALRTLTSRGNKPFLIELPEVWRDSWAPMIKGNRGTPETHILPLRNHIAHIGRLTDVAARDLLDHHKGRFEEALHSLSFLANYKLVAVDRENYYWLLQGTSVRPMSPSEISANASLDRNRVYLVKGDTNLQLFPLQLYDVVSDQSYSSGIGVQQQPMYLSTEKGTTC
jgi:hypothetical protein